MKYEFVKLESVCKVKKGTNITRKEVIDGEFPVVAGGMKPSCYHNEFNRNKNCITVSGSGNAGYVNFWSVPIFASDCITIEPFDETQDVRFVFHYLKSLQDSVIESLKRGTALPHVYKKDIANLEFPLVSIDKQRKISSMLDKLIKLENELEAELNLELQKRSKQYNYYLNLLFSFETSSNVEYKTLGELGEFFRGKSLQKRDLSDSGVGCIHYGQIYTHYGIHTDKTKSFISKSLAESHKKAQKGDLIIADTGEDDDAVCKAVAWLGENEIVVGNHAYIYRHKLDPKFVAYFFNTDQFQDQKKRFVTGITVKSVKIKDLSKIIIPLPSIEEQSWIVGMLDNFDFLVNGITNSIPAEIELRWKQYEYYRNRLLTFGEEK